MGQQLQSGRSDRRRTSRKAHQCRSRGAEIQRQMSEIATWGEDRHEKKPSKGVCARRVLSVNGIYVEMGARGHGALIEYMKRCECTRAQRLQSGSGSCLAADLNLPSRRRHNPPSIAQS